MAAITDVQQGIRFTQHRAAPDLLTDQAQAFLMKLHRRFELPRRELLADRCDRLATIRAGARPRFDPETAYVRSGDWHIAPPPADLRNRRTELTGPVSRAAMVEALNAGASVFMADLEDTTSPTWHNCLDGQLNLRDAYAGRLAVASESSTLVVRTRGWHLIERHVEIDGSPIAAALFDFGLCVYHNAHPALAAGSGPYFYLPKVEGAADARLWTQVFVFTEDALGLPRGTIRATVLIETILAAFEMDEILFEMRDHITGLHTGNWDYLFSIAKTFAHDPAFTLPDLDSIDATTMFIRSFSELLVSVCHRRGAHAIGGMSGVIPDPVDPNRTRAAMRRVAADKRREAGDGFDGTRLAHPGLVGVAAAEFERVLSYRPNQVEIQRDDVYVTESDLLDVGSHRGRRTEDGLRHSIGIALHYFGEWLAGNGCVAIDDHIEDAAMAELCRTQIWQWRHHHIVLDDATTVDDLLLCRLFDEELEKLRSMLAADAWAAGRFDDAHRLLSDITFSDELCDYFTAAAYDLI